MWSQHVTVPTFSKIDSPVATSGRALTFTPPSMISIAYKPGSAGVKVIVFLRFPFASPEWFP